MTQTVQKSKTVFVAGSTGMVGSSIIQALLSQNSDYSVRAGYFSTTPFLRNPRINNIQGDLTNLASCRELVRGSDIAIMAAAYTGGAKDLKENPARFINENLLMNARMLEAFYLEGVKRVIFIGSATLYQEFEGSVQEHVLNFNQNPAQAHFGVGWTFRFLEKLCEFWHERFGMEIILVRAANIFGPYAKFNPERSNFIPALIRKAVERMDPFEVWGAPEVTRDVIYSEDFAHAVVQLLEREEIKFEIFNIGSETPTTVAEVVRWVNEAAGHKPKEIRYVPSGPATIQFRLLDCSKIRNATGWQRMYSTREAIYKTVNWWNQNKNRWTK